MKTKIIFFLLLSLSSFANAQETTPAKNTWGVQTGFTISFFGYSVFAGATYRAGQSEFYAGPVLSISNSYLLTKGPWGVNAGWRYNFAKWKYLNSNILVDYRNAFFKPFNAQVTESKKKNSVHELNFAYGIKWEFTKSWYAGNYIGTGLYYESTYDLSEQKRFGNYGYSGLIKFLLMKEL